MADSDSQGEDLPPYTPFTSACEESADPEDLPEYTPFTDTLKPSASGNPQGNKPEIAVEEVEDVVAMESEYVQEMVVAAEGPGESFGYREEQGEDIVREGENEMPTYSQVEETVSSREDISETVEERKVQVEEEEKPQKGKKQRNRKKKGGKGQASEADSQPEPSSTEETTQVQPHKSGKESTAPVIVQERKVEMPQKPAKDSAPPQEEEMKTGPLSTEEGAALQEPAEITSKLRPTLPVSTERKKARSGRPVGAAPLAEPKVSVSEDSTILEETKETAKAPQPSEEIVEEKPTQHTLPAKGKKKLRSGKPAGPAAPSEDASQETPPVLQSKLSPEPRKPSAPAQVPTPTALLQANSPKEQPKAVISPSQLPAEETKKPLTKAPAQSEETPSIPAPRQPGLSAKARQKLRDTKQPESASAKSEAKLTTEEAPKPALPKAEIEPRLLDLEKQVHLTREKQQNAKLLTAKLLKSMEENQTKKERLQRQVEKAKQTLTQLNEELAKSSVSQEDAKSENQLKQLKARVRVLTEDLGDKETDFAARKAAREAREKEIRDIRNRRKRMEEEKKEMNRVHSEAISESESCQSEIKRLEALIKKANETMQQMKDSFSSRDLENTLKSLISKRTAKARDFGEREGRIHASLSLLETERQAYMPDLVTGPVLGSSKLAKQISEVDWELRNKTEEMERLQGEVGVGGVGCCPLLFLLLGLLLGVLVHQLV